VNRISAVYLAACGLLTLAIAMGVGRFAFTPILPMMQNDHGLSLRLAGLLASANYVGYFAGALSAIWMRATPRVVVRSSLLAIAILTAAMGVVHAPWAWMLLRALAGFASAWILIFASAYILEQLAAQGRKQLGGVVFGGVGAGIALTGILCLLFLNLSWTADNAWIAAGAVALALAVPCWPAYAAATQARPKAQAGSSPLRLRKFSLVIVCYGIFGFGYIIPATFLPAMARQIVPDPAVFGWVWPVFGTMALLSTLAAGWLSSRFPNRLIWATSHAIMAVGVVMPVLQPGAFGIALSACLVGGTFMVATMTGLQEARALGKDQAPRLMASITTAFAIGQIAGPLLVSLAAGSANGMDMILIGDAVLLLGTAAVLATGVKKRQREQ
jgi:MFS family permease